jgi:endoplasmic reticulum lectin 1
VCTFQGKHEVYSFEEVKTCEYEVIILSPLLCAHPDYRVRDQLHNDINCYAAGEIFRKRGIIITVKAFNFALMGTF